MIRNVGGGWRLREFKMEEGKKKEKKKKMEEGATRWHVYNLA